MAGNKLTVFAFTTIGIEDHSETFGNRQTRETFSTTARFRRLQRDDAR